MLQTVLCLKAILLWNFSDRSITELCRAHLQHNQLYHTKIRLIQLCAVSYMAKIMFWLCMFLLNENVATNSCYRNCVIWLVMVISKSFSPTMCLKCQNCSLSNLSLIIYMNVSHNRYHSILCIYTCRILLVYDFLLNTFIHKKWNIV